MRTNAILLLFLLCVGQLIAQPNPVNFIQSTAAVDIRAFGNDARRWLVQGDNLMRQARWEEAILAYDNAIIQLPEWAAPYVKRGVAKARMGRDYEASADLNRAYRLGRYNMDLFNDLAPTGKYALMATASSWEDDLTDSIRLLCALKENGQLSQASNHIGHLYDTGQVDSRTYIFLSANLLLLQNDHSAAIAHYDWLLDDEEDAQVLHNRGLAKLLLYNFADGCHDLERAAKLGHAASQEQIVQLCGM